MSKLLKVCLAVIVAAGALYWGYTQYRKNSRPALVEVEVSERFYEPVLGIYDRTNKVTQEEAKSMKHFALVLHDANEWHLQHNPLEQLDKAVPVLLTVEMWGKGMLEEVASGGNEAHLKALLTTVLNDRQHFYIRWNPEMEVPADLYTWSNQPSGYIAAFQKFSDICHQVAPGAKVLYAPAGYAGALESYPGDEAVDAASITLNSNAEAAVPDFEPAPVPAQLSRKLHRLRFVDKPVLVLGSKNMDVASFQEEWTAAAQERIEENKEVIYAAENFKRNNTDWEKNRQKFMVGLYDPDLLIVKHKAVTVEHIFIDFAHIETGEYVAKLQGVFDRGHDLILTVEPTTWNKEEDLNRLDRIIAGEFDGLIEKFYNSIPKTNHTIYLRFAHEMEIPITRYAWQSQDPVTYIKAFRYFINFPHTNQLNIKKVWGPAGDRGSLDWWPGNDAVDYISIAIYGLPDKNITDPNQQENFSLIYTRKAWRFRFVDKPIFITEFGVKGDEDFQTKWLKGAAKTVNKNPRIAGINYFNMPDIPQAWGEIKPPDWSISTESFEAFVNALD